MNKIKLFCFPYAGGSAVVFHRWRQYLHPAIELVPIELAGRGRRIHEPLYEDVHALLHDVLEKLGQEIVNGPYALFGHSLGSMISFELALRIRQLCLPAPLHLFFSGRSAPHVKKIGEKVYHLMDDEEFKNEVMALGGTPAEFFIQPELTRLFLPLLRNDFRLAETDLHNGEIIPFDENITVFLGKEDDLSAEQCDGWKKYTTKVCTMYYFEGGHFFLHNESEKMVRIINDVLNKSAYGIYQSARSSA